MAANAQYSRGMGIDSADYLWCAGWTDLTGSDDDFLLFKCANDGSGLGTFGVYTYVARGGATNTNRSFTAPAPSFTQHAAPGLTVDSPRTLTNQTRNLTETIIA